MKYIREYNSNQISFNEFKSNLSKENKLFDELISELPIDLVIKAKKELARFNISSILKKIYNHFINKTNESIIDYILGLGGMHSIITLAKWFREFRGRKFYKYFLMLFGLDERTADNESHKTLIKMSSGIVIVICLIYQLTWVFGREVNYRFESDEGDRLACRLVATYNSNDGDYLTDESGNRFILLDDGSLMYDNKKVGYIKDGELYDDANNLLLHQTSDFGWGNTYANLKDILDIKDKKTKYDDQIHDMKIKLHKQDSIANVNRYDMTSKIDSLEQERMKELNKQNENVDQAKSILRKLNKPENDPAFLRIKELLKSNLGYCGLFTKFYYKDNESYESLVSVYNKIKELGNKVDFLDKNIIDYDSLESLDDDLSRIDDKIFINKIWNILPAKQKRLFYSYDTQSYQRKNFDEVAILLKDKPSAVSQFERKISAYHSYADLVNYMKNLAISDANFQQTYNKCKKLSGVYIRYANKEKGILIVRVSLYESMKELGSKTSWCIARDRRYFDKYSSKGQQFILYDFKRSDNNSIIGITVNTHTHITDAHDKYDGSISYYLGNKESNFYNELDLTQAELFKHIQYKADNLRDKIVDVLNRKPIAKFLDFY